MSHSVSEYYCEYCTFYWRRNSTLLSVEPEKGKAVI